MNRTLNRFRSLVCSIASGVAMILCSHRAAALIIDDFTQGEIALLQATNFAGNTVVQTGLDPSHTLGGTRSVYVGSLSLASSRTETGKGRFHFAANTDYGYFKLDWGSVTPLNINLASGNNRFQLDFVDTTPNVSLSLFDLRVKSGGTWFSYGIGNDFASALNGNTFGTLSIPFSKFPGVNFSQVQAIELDAARVPQGFHLAIDTFTVVPEPTTWSLGLLAAAVFGLRRSLLTNACRSGTELGPSV